jgi:hypothetical protein
MRERPDDFDEFRFTYRPDLFSRGPNWSRVGSAQQNHASVSRGGRNRRGLTNVAKDSFKPSPRI